jgi:hypothetical protein
VFQFGTVLTLENKMLSSNSIKLGVRDKLKKKRRTDSTPKDPNRVRLSTCVGKLTAYVRVNNQDEAKLWAKALVEHLHKMGLLDG